MINNNSSKNSNFTQSLNDVNQSLNGFRFGIDANGNYGYKKAGADTVIPFKTSKTHTAYAHVRLEAEPTSNAWIYITVTIYIDGVAYTAYPKTKTGLINHRNGDVDARNTNTITFTDK